MRIGPSKQLALLLMALLALGLVSGCANSPQLGARPSGSLMDAVETYLQRYQPGPEPRLFQTTRVLDRRGRLLAVLWNEGRRTWVELDRISPHLIAATVATEDASFYSNLGVDPARIAGAALQNVQEGDIVSGASTITMQLARNLFLGPDQRYDQSIDRKMLEAGLAQELTTLFSKDELLEMYLNLLNYGSLAYGPEAAARTYFDKPAADLTLAEATLLAGIPQQPARLNPRQDWEAAKARQRIVLDLMVRHGYLPPTEADSIYADPIALAPAPAVLVQAAPHFVQYLEQDLEARLGVADLGRAGLIITSTLDLDLHTVAQDIIRERVAALQPQYDLSNAALVALRPGTGEILAMVGSVDFYNDLVAGQVNVATSPRQPGSAIKPILYATAFDDNLASPATVIWDTPITYTVSASEIYAPINYDQQFHGPVTARTALASSYNVPAIKLLDGLTVERMLRSAQSMGLRSLSRDHDWYGLSLTLGGGEVTLLDLTTAYSTLANGGRLLAPRPVLAIRDSRGRIVQVYGPSEPLPAVSPGAAFLVTDILSDNSARTPAFGPESVLRLSRPAAVKTGTTSDWRDNWTVGYTRYLVAGVWAGNSDGRPMRNTTGLTGAAPIWHDFMEAVLASPNLLEVLEVPADAAAWEFIPTSDVERVDACPPGVTCRTGGEFFTRAWLEAAGETGPLADSVVLAPTAPVYADHGQGPTWTAYCQVEPAVMRPLLALPGKFGLPGSSQTQFATGTARETGPGPGPSLAPQAADEEQAAAIAWSLSHPTPVNLGKCSDLEILAQRAMLQDPQLAGMQVFVDLAAAQDPNAGPVAGAATLTQIGSPGVMPAPGRYTLAQAVTHHDSCPGNYIVGQVLNAAGAPLPGVRIAMVDQWGNRADAISKSGEVDLGRYDFPLNYFANRYTVTVVDDAGNSISPAIVVDHLQGEGGTALCHTIVWRAG